MDISELVLSEEERKKISRIEGMGRDYDIASSLKTARKVWNMEHEFCKEHSHDNLTQRIDCPKCCESIQKALEEG